MPYPETDRHFFISRRLNWCISENDAIGVATGIFKIILVIFAAGLLQLAMWEFN